MMAQDQGRESKKADTSLRFYTDKRGQMTIALTQVQVYMPPAPPKDPARDNWDAPVYLVDPFKPVADLRKLISEEIKVPVDEVVLTGERWSKKRQRIKKEKLQDDKDICFYRKYQGRVMFSHEPKVTLAPEAVEAPKENRATNRPGQSLTK